MPADAPAEQASSTPFSSLLAMSSLLAALLLVAGFSYRWAYYYNFGLKDLVLQASLQSVAVSALELIRTPRSALLSLLIVALPIGTFNVLAFAAKTRAAGGRSPRLFFMARSIGLDAPLFADIVRALLLFYSAYWAGSEAGYQKFLAHITEGADNTLPRVSVISTGAGGKGAVAFECAKTDWAHPDGGAGRPGEAARTLIGSAAALQAMTEGTACDVAGQRTWRLLYRDDKFTYLFATGSAATRPLTVVLANTDNQILVLGATK